MLLAKYSNSCVACEIRLQFFVSLVQTNLGTKSVCSLVTKRSNGFGYTNLDHSRSHKIEKNKNKNGFGPFLYKFFVPIRVGLLVHKIRLHGRRGKGMTEESFSRETLRHAPQKEGG